MAHTRISRSNALIDFEVQLVTQANNAYDAGDVVAELITFAKVAEAGRGSAGFRVVSACIKDLDAQDVDYDLFLFDANPSGTTLTLDSALDVADADLPKLIGHVNIDDGIAFADSIYLRGEPDKPLYFALPEEGTDLFGVLVTRGTPTYAASAAGVSVRLVLERL